MTGENVERYPVFPVSLEVPKFHQGNHPSTLVAFRLRPFSIFLFPLFVAFFSSRELYRQVLERLELLSFCFNNKVTYFPRTQIFAYSRSTIFDVFLCSPQNSNQIMPLFLSPFLSSLIHLFHVWAHFLSFLPPFPSFLDLSAFFVSALISVSLLAVTKMPLEIKAFEKCHLVLVPGGIACRRQR